MRIPFTELIRKRRDELQITQEGLANKVKRSSSWVALVESGRRRPDLEVVPALALALGKDPTSFTMMYLHQYFPAVARVLFDQPSPEVEDRPPDHPHDEIVRMLADLPEEVRDPIERLIRSAHDLLARR